MVKLVFRRIHAVGVKNWRFNAVGTCKQPLGRMPSSAPLTMNTNVISIEDWDSFDGFSAAVRDPKGYVEPLKRCWESAEHR